MSTPEDKDVDLESQPPCKKVRWNRNVNVDESGVEISHNQTRSDSDSSDTEESERPSKVST